MLKAAPHHLVVAPTGDNDETQVGQLIVVENTHEAQKVFRGVVEHVGARVPTDDGLEAGCVAHYTAYHEVGRQHVVPMGNLIAFEDNE